MDVVQVQPYFAFAWWANVLSDEFMVLWKDLEFIQRQLFNLDVIILFWVDELLTLIASLIHFSCTFAASPIDKVTHLEHTIWVRMVGLIDFGNMYLACGTEIQALWPNALAQNVLVCACLQDGLPDLQHFLRGLHKSIRGVSLHHLGEFFLVLMISEHVDDPVWSYVTMILPCRKPYNLRLRVLII